MKHEISRKSVTVMDRLISRHMDGELTERELKVALDAVFDTIQGLAERSVEATLYAFCRELAL